MIDLNQILTILPGDCRETLKQIPDGVISTCVTSPPYYGLRDYGTGQWGGGDPDCKHVVGEMRRGTGLATSKASTRGGGHKVAETPDIQARSLCPKCGAFRTDRQIGMENTPEEFIDVLVSVFREVKRVLRPDGTLWINMGDSYANDTKWGGKQNGKNTQVSGRQRHRTKLPSKSLMGMPWRLAFALQEDGWVLRQDIIWCLSGGTVVYARTKKGDGPMMLKDVARLDPATVKLWNGEKWTQVLGWSRTSRNADELEIVLRSGERISCTPTHQFPSERGLLRASEIIVGDKLKRVRLPEPEHPKRPHNLQTDAAWLAGLYLAEGSMSEDTIQIAGHAEQTERLMRIQAIAENYGGSVTCTVKGNEQAIRIYGRVLRAIIEEFVSGGTAKDKGIAPVCWRYSNDFLLAFLQGYLAGDGHYDSGNARWRLGFTRNYNLERDLRTLAARLGCKIKLEPCSVDGFGAKWPAFRGELRFETSGHFNERSSEEVMEIRRSRCREVYDVGVEDEPHLFALASGILTHNSKPNPMPESVRDRCTKAHEYIFLFAKNPDYYFDQEAILEPVSGNTHARLSQNVQAQIGSERANGGVRADRPMKAVARKPSAAAREFPAAALRDDQRRRKANMPNGWANSPRYHEGNPQHVSRKFGTEGVEKNNASMDAALAIMPEERNKRDVWEVPEEHFNLESESEPAPDFSDGRPKRADAVGGNKHTGETTLHSDGFVYTGTRPQRLRAEQLAHEAGLTAEHIEAIRACGITDTGKTAQTQTGTGQNTERMMALAAEAKEVLGGYYREFLVADERNKRSVWTVTTKGFKEAHFATFPPDLIRPCILAGCPPMGKRCDCEKIIATPTGKGGAADPSMEVGRAGMSRERLADEGTRFITRREQRHEARQIRALKNCHAWMIGICGSLEALKHYMRTDKTGARALPEAIRQEFRARGWITEAPPCTCPVEPAGIVLDPFGGSGTTGMVAIEEGRRAILCELNPIYAAMSDKRCEVTIPLSFA